MTDKQFEKERKRVRRLWFKWFKPIGMGWWQVELSYDRARDEDEPATAGLTTTNWQYRTAAVTFFLPATAAMSEEDLEEVVVHEMVHIMCGPIQDMSSDDRREITEHTVTTIARSIMWARKAGEDTAKKAPRK